jgi:hypothetical protein
MEDLKHTSETPEVLNIGLQHAYVVIATCNILDPLLQHPDETLKTQV